MKNYKQSKSILNYHINKKKIQKMSILQAINLQTQISPNAQERKRKYHSVVKYEDII